MKNPERRERNEQRLNAATNVAAGGALLAGAAGASYANDRALERKGLQPPVKTVMARGKLRPAHARYGAAKLGIRGLQVTGIPLAAYGAYNLVKPDEKVKRVSAKDDIAKPIARGVTFRDAADDYRKRVAKRLIAFEPGATKVSNTLGIAAIGTGSAGSFNYASQQRLEAKQVKKALPSKWTAALDPKFNHGGLMGGWIGPARQPLSPESAAATKKTRSRVRAAMKRGGSLKRVARNNSRRPEVVSAVNERWAKDAQYARDVKEWRKIQSARKGTPPVSKALPDKMRHAGRMRRVLGYDARRKQIILDNPADPTAPYRVARGGKKPPKPPAEPTQMRLPFGKRDDRFLRRYKDRISPDAERGYNSMRRQRNKDRAWAATQAGLTGLNAAGLAAALKSRSKVWTPVTAAATAFSGSQAVRHARKARGYDKGPMEGIRRKAHQREREGLYGPGRGLEPVDATSRRVKKQGSRASWQGARTMASQAERDARKYITNRERRINRAQTTGGAVAALGGMYAGHKMVNSGLKDVGRAARQYQERLSDAQDRNAARQPALGRGPRRVTPGRDGVYDIRGKDQPASGKKPRAQKGSPARKWRGAHRKVVGGFGVMAAAPLVYMANNVRVAHQSEQRIKQRKAADQARVTKAAVPAPRSVPKGMLRRPTIRSGHVARRPRGRMVSVRGSFG